MDYKFSVDFFNGKHRDIIITETRAVNAYFKLPDRLTPDEQGHVKSIKIVP